IRQLVFPVDVIEDDLERPGRGNTHGRLNQHGNEDHDQPFAVRLDESENELEHALGGCSFQRRWCDFLVGGWCFTHELKSGEKASTRLPRLRLVRKSIPREFRANIRNCHCSPPDHWYSSEATQRMAKFFP